MQTCDRMKGKKARLRCILRTAGILLCLSAVLLSACSKPPPSATDLMAILLSELEHPEMQLYFEGALQEGDGWIAQETMETLYCGKLPAEYAADYAIALCKDDRIYEIHLYYALNATAASQIEEFLRGRLEAIQQKENYLFDPDSAAASGIVWKRGKWVCLLVTEDNGYAKTLLKERI